jgi:hypothetical protein
MRFDSYEQLATKEFPICFLLQGVQMVGVAKSLTPHSVANSETDDGQAKQRDKDSPAHTSSSIVLFPERMVLSG